MPSTGKTQTIIKMSGYTLTGEPVRTHNWQETRSFRDPSGAVTVKATREGKVLVTTANGSYTLDPVRTSKNLFTGMANGIKVHFTKQKIVGKLIYWS